MPKPKRNRRLTNVEKDFLRVNVATKSIREMAAELNRPEALIEDFLRADARSGATAETTDPIEITDALIRQDLRASHTWKAVVQEFSREELKLFEEIYVKWMTQFKGDVLPSEETQIFQAAKFEILMNRELREQRRLRDEVELVEKEITEKLAEPEPGSVRTKAQYKAELKDLRTRRDQLAAAEVVRSQSYLRYQEGHADLMKSLKGTRDQRVKEIEKGNVNFIDVIKRLSNPEARQREGRTMGLLKLAAKKSAEELGRPMIYGDGQVDSPILNHETVGSQSNQEDKDED